jgi:circadian clock protein KaiB
MTAAADRPYQLKLFISGNGSRSARAIVNVRRICEEHLPGRYHLDVIDITLHPAQARAEQLIAVPTLVKSKPLPVRRFIGDMSRTEAIVSRLELEPTGGAD